jgi:hypothetical protein
MVELPGSLERSTLGDVLGALHRDRVSGALRLSEVSGGKEHHHVIYWHDGLIHHVETTRSLPARSWMDARASYRGAEHWTRNDAGKWQRLERLEALFELRNAKLSFRVMGRHPARAPEPLEPTEFLHGRRRQRDAEAAFAPRVVPIDTPHSRALRTLGLDGEPSTEDVRAAFRQLARRWHPDRHPQAGEQTRAALCRRFSEIATAYQELMARSA